MATLRREIANDVFSATQLQMNLQLSLKVKESFEKVYPLMLKMYQIYLARPNYCLLYTSPSPRDKRQSRMPSSA